MVCYLAKDGLTILKLVARSGDHNFLPRWLTLEVALPLVSLNPQEAKPPPTNDPDNKSAQMDVGANDSRL
jgi:hypothetical protein